MPLWPQNARVARSQPVLAKQRFCTKAGLTRAPSWIVTSCASDTLLTPSRRAFRVSCRASIARHTAQSVSFTPLDDEGPCRTYESTYVVRRCSSELSNDWPTCVAG